MNQTQIKTILTPIVGFLAAWLASRFPLLDPTTWNTLVSTVIFAIVTVVMGLLTKNTSLADTVGKLPGTTVVTTPEIASALPDNKDVIPSTPAIANAVKNS